MKKNILAFTFLFSSVLLFGQSSPAVVKAGAWRGEIKSIGGLLPINFLVEAPKGEKIPVKIQNGAEKFSFGDAYFRNDSLIVPFDLYDSELALKPVSDTKLSGLWIKRRNGAMVGTLPVEASFGSTERFLSLMPSTVSVAGKWQTDFFGDDGKPSPGVGVFEQQGNQITGTFLRTSGDYRFLQGNVSGDSLLLSYFDGSAVYLMKAKINADKTFTGTFFSGFAGKRSIKGKLDPKAALPDLKTLTSLKPGKNSLQIALPTPTGEIVRLSDERFKNKVVVVELLGSWCPNCLDESRYLAPFYKKNKAKGIEMLGVAFEYSSDIKVSGPKIENFKKRIGIEYPIVFAGQPNDETIAKVLPELEKLNGYPTTFIIDKKGVVREIHTGFSGPGTGVYYTDWIHEFEKTIQKLLNE
jgi:thiol-disulfide isomerase/thioredoxin